MIVDPSDESVYAVGYSTVQFGTRQWVGRWDFAGDEVWVSVSEGAGEQGEGEELVLDAKGWLRVVGADKIEGTWAVVITTLDRVGVELDRTIWQAPEGDVRALGVAARGDSLVVVGGTGDGFQAPQMLIAEFGIP